MKDLHFQPYINKRNYIDTQEDSSLNKQAQITEHFIEWFSEHLDNTMLEGLSRKGYTLDPNNKPEIISFIKENCMSATRNRTTTYYVKGQPFLAITRDDPNISWGNDSSKINMDSGITFKFL